MLLRNLDQKEKMDVLSVQARMGQLASQVAHDIRSPLAALNMVAATVAHIPEEERVVIRNAIHRIRDIANNLLEKHKGAGTAATTRQEVRTGPLSAQLLSGMIDTIVSEKRLQFRSEPEVRIEADLAATSYGIFSEVEPIEFKRALSNIINNAVEAFLADAPAIDRRTEIYLDSDLGNGVCGETYVKKLKAMGFRDIILATGYERDRFSDLPGINGVTGKDPPW